ncbi:TPA: hypothetical protein I8619_001083 [Citrobacter freundii]|nr:hypothetical protein [Citrobacter freundii]
MTKLVLVLTGVGQAAQSLIIGLGLIRRGSFTRAVLMDDDLMAGVLQCQNAGFSLTPYWCA